MYNLSLSLELIKASDYDVPTHKMVPVSRLLFKWPLLNTELDMPALHKARTFAQRFTIVLFHILKQLHEFVPSMFKTLYVS
jgi:hypothetical protein